MRLLLKNRRNIKKQIKTVKNSTAEKKLLKRKVKLINLMIEETENLTNLEQGQKIAERITSVGGVSSPKFWEVIKIKPKAQDDKVAMKNDKGVIKETTEENLEIYKKHYEKLLQTPTPK